MLGNNQRIDFALMPPSPLIAGRVVFAVVKGAKRHCKLIAHLEGKASGLRIADMMGMGWGAATDDAWLLRNKTQVFF